MNAHTEPTIIRDAGGHPAFVVLPIAEYQALKKQAHIEPTVPASVVNTVFDHDWTPIRAWREHLKLSQVEVATRLGITQSAYAQQESSSTLRKSSKLKIAAALGVGFEQLDF